jgi:hypothetical protein
MIFFIYLKQAMWQNIFVEMLGKFILKEKNICLWIWFRYQIVVPHIEVLGKN